MRVNELMHGDWVLYPIQNNEPAQVCGKILSYEKELGNAEVDLLPIPLTIEMLKKNGWNGDYSRTYPKFDSFRDADNDSSLEISVFEDGEMRVTVNLCEYDLFPIKYVHELQHALRLCGLSKLADNFKV